MKHRFIDINKVATSYVQTTNYEFSGPFAYLKLRISDHASSFLRCSTCKKWLHMAFRNLETSIHRLHQSRFYYEFLFKTSLKQLRPRLSFQFQECRNRVPMTPTPGNNALSTSTKSNFKTYRKKDYVIPGPFAYFIHHLSEFIQVTLFHPHDAENDFV
jgi:hypothetical protein